VPRVRIIEFRNPSEDSADAFDDVHEQFDEPAQRRRRDRPIARAPRVVLEGKSGRTLVDVDQVDADQVDAYSDPSPGEYSARSAELPYSSYDVASHGPDPVPEWVITSLSARDTRLGAIKSGKEADVELVDRSLPQGPGCLLAVKTFRGADHRMFHRDTGYQEGRRIRRSRETRAMAARTSFGRELLSGQWAGAEFAALSRLWKLGARVPYPVQLIGSELMMEFIGDPDGTAAPRLAAYEANTADFTELYHDLVCSLEVLAQAGLTHGDLSAYNVLVTDGGCVVIDLPQVVDLVANPQGGQFLRRDCRNIADFFARRGVLAADAELLELHLSALAVP
jgi:RIO kinase 1